MIQKAHCRNLVQGLLVETACTGNYLLVAASEKRFAKLSVLFVSVCSRQSVMSNNLRKNKYVTKQCSFLSLSRASGNIKRSLSIVRHLNKSIANLLLVTCIYCHILAKWSLPCCLIHWKICHQCELRISHSSNTKLQWGRNSEIILNWINERRGGLCLEEWCQPANPLVSRTGSLWQNITCPYGIGKKEMCTLHWKFLFVLFLFISIHTDSSWSL